jgi:phosphate transport system substrate-binding protein
MNVRKIATLTAAVGALFASSSVLAQSLVKIDGSSTVFPVSEAVAEEFQKAQKGKIRVTVGVSGTGGGFKKFCRGETDISNASRPILQKEMDECKANGVEYIELPIAFDALTVVVNTKNDWVDKGVTVKELKAMWEPAAQGKITKWNQINPAWPDRALKLFGAGADSGTFDYFTEAVTGKSKSSRGDFTASEDDNILVQGVSRDTNALGFFGYAYYEENKDKLKAVKIIADGGKEAVGPSMETVLDGSYTPLSRPIMIYISAKSLAKPEVREFVDFYNKEGSKLIREVKYVPLPAKAYEYNLQQVAKGVKGTKFGGENKVGITIEQLMALEAK